MDVRTNIKHNLFEPRSFKINNRLLCVIKSTHIEIWRRNNHTPLTGTAILESDDSEEIMQTLSWRLYTSEYLNFQKQLFEDL